MFKTAANAIVAVSVISLTGCASIVSKSDWPVTIQTEPAGAKCTVSQTGGEPVQIAETPMTVTLSSKGGFFSSAGYKVSCQKDGFKPGQADFEAHLNGWYWGNLVFGGLIGWLIVDPATGAMWKLEDKQLLTMEKLAEAPKEAKVTAAP